jgi:hypothetical protein
LAALAVAATAAGVGVAIAAQPAAAASTDAMIAEVYGGGGNSGATLISDFVELANAGGSAASVDGWSVQYLPAAASPSSTWQLTKLTGSIPASGRFLVGEGSGTGGTVALPSADASGSIAMSATAGTIALVSTQTPLTCKTAADCAADPAVKDLVGFGTAVVREGSPAPAGTNASALARGTLVDTDDNSADFTSGAPTPTNAAGDTTGGDPTPPTPAKIHDIQGNTRLSPLDGKKVGDVTGVVTAVRQFGSAQGYWLQDTQPDADPATSEGVFVFTGSTKPAVAVGDAVTITSATVDEFYPDASATSSVQQSTTELTSAQATVTSHSNAVPAAEKLGPNTVPTAFTPEPGGSIEALALQPTKYALDFYESREGMLAEIDDAHVVGPSTSFNELWITSKPQQNPTPRGGTLYSGYDQQNSGRMLVESLIPFADHPFPKVNTGDRLAGVTAGPVSFSEFGGYELLATQLGDRVDGGIKPEVTRAQRSGELAVATYNVENLAPSDPQAKFDRLATAVVTHLASPDILSIEEIQDNSGATDDGVVASDVTTKKFTDAIVAAGGPHYEVRSIDPENDKDGGQPGGNIRVSFLFNPARVSFVDIPGGTATTPVTVKAGRFPLDPQLSASPGRIAPTDEAWEDSRKPLVGEFSFRGHPVFVIGNHFDSKGGDQPLAGRNQPPTRSSEIQRVKQATLVNGFVKQIEKIDPLANVVVLGDMNDYPFSPALGTLTGGHALTDLIKTLPKAEQYSYVFQGNSQVLDHILTSPFVLLPSYDVVHINAEFADQASDHDPQVVRFYPTSVPWPGAGH